MQSSSPELEDLLQRWSGGDGAAFDELVPIVYDGLRQVARERRRYERSDNSLNTTALVHEAYLKLAGLRHASFRDRAHFLAMASRVMRRVLVDHARARKAGKRGSDLPHAELVEDIGMTDENAALLADLNEALDELRIALLIELSLPALRARVEAGDAIQPSWTHFLAALTSRYGLPGAGNAEDSCDRRVDPGRNRGGKEDDDSAH